MVWLIIVLLEVKFASVRLTHHQQHEFQSTNVLFTQSYSPVQFVDLHAQVIADRVPIPSRSLRRSPELFHLNQQILQVILSASDCDDVVILFAILHHPLCHSFL